MRGLKLAFILMSFLSIGLAVGCAAIFYFHGWGPLFAATAGFFLFWFVAEIVTGLIHYTYAQFVPEQKDRAGSGAPMTVAPFPADEFTAFIRERFPSARIERTSNELGTVWIEVRTDARHAEIVATSNGVIGGTDIARLDLKDEDANPFAPFDKQLDSVQAARDFMIRALS